MPRKIDDSYLGSNWQNEKNIDKISERYNENNALFFIFSIISLVIIGSVMAMMWYLLEPGLMRIHAILPKLLMVALSGLWILLFVDIFLIALTVTSGINCIPYYHKTKRVKYLMPFILRLGMVLGIVPDRMISSFISVNNRLIQVVHKKKKRENILVLLPRCLQHFSCNQPVVTDINACKSCGKCDIVKLVHINKHYNLITAIATGGGIAKKLIRDLKPHGIIAVACERELMEGMKGIHNVPIVAISNSRPEGPCKNTKVDVAAIERAVKLFKNG